MSTTTGLEIAVIGMAGRFPGAESVEELWANVCAGRSAISTFADEELDAAGVTADERRRPEFVRAGGVLDGAEFFDAAFFGYSPRDASVLDPQQRVFLECAYHALEDAGYAERRRRELVGVYAGSSLSTYLTRHLLANPDVMRDLSDHELVLSNDKDTLATRVAYHLDLGGPAVSVQTACSTSLVAIHAACQALLSGDCDIALAGGVSVRLPQHEGYLYREGSILSPNGRCLPFDAEARGAVGGNGVGVVVLKPLAAALDDGDTIRAVVKSTAVNNDGSGKVGFTAPSVSGQAAVLRAALQLAEVPLDSIGYVEAHGTGTELGDPIEVAALKQAFAGTTERNACAIGSIKALVGHLDAAAGVTGFIKAVLAVERGIIPPSPYFTRPNPALALDDSPFYVNREPQPWPPRGHARRAGVSAFGMGGTNAHAIVEQPPTPEPRSEGRPYRLFVLSARTEAALAESRRRLGRFLELEAEASLDDVAYTLQVTRRAMPHRFVTVCRDREEALERLSPDALAGSWTAVQTDNSRQAVFLLPGQGAQYPGMGRGLYDAEPTFRRVVDECAEILRTHLRADIRDAIFPASASAADAAERLGRTQLTQPALFTVEYALARLWEAWGVRPKALIGHSVGELVAACLAGTMDLPDALALIAARGQLMGILPRGSMLSVPLGETDVLPYLDGDVAVASANAPALTVVAGPTASVERVAARLAAAGVAARLLRTSHAFHSPMMDPIVGAFGERVARITLRPPTVPFVSNITGDWITAADATDPGYWARHVRHPVRFSEGLLTILGDGPQILLEVGPGNSLATLARQHDRERAHTILSSMRHPKDAQDDGAVMLATAGRLWLAGAAVDFAGASADQRRRRVPVPTYPFERSRHWIELPRRTESTAPAPASVAATRAEHDTTTDTSATATTLGTAGTSEDPVVRAVARVWGDLLGIAEIGPHEDFFELGGHSLVATQVLAHLRDSFDVALPASAIFEAPTVAGLSAVIERQLEARRSEEAELARILAEIRRLSPDELRAELETGNPEVVSR